MPTMKTLLPLLAAAAVAAQSQVQSQGCYSSAGSLENLGENIYQSTGYCTNACDKSIIATKGKECYCGDDLPPSGDKVEDSKCDIACAGYPYETCGGDDYWSVSTTDSDASGNMTSASSAASSTSESATSSVVAPAGNANITASSSTGSSSTLASSTTSTSTPSEYTGAAAQPAMGAGAIAMGALFALL